LKVIIHIGTEKTGTSSIQSYLYLNRKKLRSAGFHFIQSAGKWNNWMLPAFCSIDAKFNEFFWSEGVRTPDEELLFKQKFIKKFEQEIQSLPADIHTCIISSEHFHSRIRSEAEMENVYNLFSSYFDEIKIVCYLREQLDACISYYSTHMKSGGTDSFLTFLQRCKPSNYYFNYYEMLANWERCFGVDALDVSLFAQDRFLNGDLLDDFTRRIDASLVGALNKSVVTENESLRPFGQALARAVNIAFPVKSERPEVDDIRVRCKKLIIHRLSGKGQQPGLQARKLMYESFIESNERLRQKFFPNIEILFPPHAEVALSDYVITEDDFGTIADVLDIIRNLGRGIISAEEYTRTCEAIFSSINDVSKVVSTTNEVGTSVVLSEKDAVLLGLAARRFECREQDSALRLMTLANIAAPNLQWLKLKLDEYHRSQGQAPKSQYMLICHSEETATDSEKKEIFARFGEWLVLQDFVAGNFLVGFNSRRTVDTEGAISEDNSSGFHGYTIIQAESMDAAVALAQECPILGMPGFIQVAELNFALV
jgi:hypothetical protein